MSSDPTSSGVVVSSEADQRRVARPLPGWTSVAILAVCLLGGAWFLWWFVAGSAPAERTVTLKEVPRQARRGPRSGDGPVGSVFTQLVRTTTGVLVVKPGEWRVRAPGDVVMRIVKQTGNRLDYSFYYDRNDLVPPDQLALLVFRAEMLANDDAARAANITPAQMATFKALQKQTGMAIGPADRAELIGLWETYLAANAGSKAAAERALVARLDAIGKTNLAATKQQMSARAAQVKAALTADQLARIPKR